MCDDCGKEETDHTCIQLTSLGRCIEYTVRSFPVFEAKLQHIKYRFFNDNDDAVYDAFVQAKEAAGLKPDCVLKLCKGYKNAFLVEPEEFSKNVDVSGLKLVDGKVFVIWKWVLWSDEDEDSVSEGELPNSRETDNDCSEEEMQEEPETSAFDMLCSVVFKCVGTMKEEKYQHILANTALAKRNKVKVKARMLPEPNNPVDAKAIAFQILTETENKWERVGYALHREILAKNIVAVELEWIKFITHWHHSNPGWYCGIKITKKGLWDNNVMRCKSTI